MKFRWAFLIQTAIFLVAPHVHALENIRWKQTQSATYFAILHSEDGQFFIDEYEKIGGQWQNRISQTLFVDAESARQRFEQITNGFSKERVEVPQTEGAELWTADVIGEDIWTATNEWNADWETKFSDWLSENATPEFFYENGIATDCADVAYAFRWIFSRIHSLPAANRLAGTRALFHNGSMRPEWVRLKKNSDWRQDSRFMAALNYLLDNTYTHTLMADMYPVAIRRNSFNGGTIHLNLYSEESGHTEFVSKVILDKSHPGPIQIIASTVPRELRLLSEYTFDFWGGPLVEGQHAFVKFLWAKHQGQQWSLVNQKDIPGFSLEQFDPNFANGYKNEGEAIIFKLIPNWAPNPRAVLKNQVTKVLQRLSERVSIVANGFAYCTNHSDCVPGGAGWEIWSTPSRDKAITRLIDSINVVYNQDICDQKCMDELDHYRSRVITRIDGADYTFEDAINAWVNYAFTSDPRDSIAKRWGYTPISTKN